MQKPGISGIDGGAKDGEQGIAMTAMMMRGSGMASYPAGKNLPTDAKA